METEEREQPQKKEPETVTMTVAERDAIIRERDEAKRSEREWANRALHGHNGNGHKQDEVVEPEPDIVDTEDLLPEAAADFDKAIFEDPDKWLAAIAKGPAAIEAFLKSKGMVTAAEAAEIAAKVARRTINVERTRITTDNRLMTTFPELADNQSELFKETAKHYQELIDFDPDAKKYPSTLFAAAKAAKASLARRRSDDEEDYGYEDRRARIAAQDGSHNGRASRAPAENEETLGPQAREVLAKMGVTEDKFRAKAKELGVNVRRKR